VVQVYQNIGHIILMLVLLAGSAFFSGAETAFFNLSRRQINLLQKSDHKLKKLAARLLSRPNQLLSCLLFGNMTINILFYAVACVFTISVEQQVGVKTAAVTAFLAFISLILFGEILPKYLAYGNSEFLSVAAALPVFLFLQIFKPITSVLRFLTGPIVRLFPGPVKYSNRITPREFRALIKASQKNGLMNAGEDKLLSEVIELGFLKVRDCLRPRVDMVACSIEDLTRRVCEVMRENHLTKLPVYIKTIDNIVGMVHLRHLLLQPDKSLDKLIQKADFVPEQEKIESLLEFFRRTGTDTAIVVDEYGGISGSICLEDIAEELLGPIELTDAAPPIERTGPFEYRLSGNLSVRDWAETFGIVPSETRISTIGGLVTALLGKAPKAGDVTHLKNLKFTVERVRKRRIETVILSLEPIPVK
jgi:putative hemolysin